MEYQLRRLMPCFGISKVKYNSNHTQVDRVVKHLINEWGVFDGRMASRYEVMDGLHNGVSYKTITLGSNNTCEIGPDLKIVVLDGAEYIKNESSSLSCDDLGNLPEF